jgi:hypothetical protein
MAEACAIAATAILLALAVFEALLAAGRPLGRYAWGGAHDVLPLGLRIASAASIPIYLFMALVLLDAADLVEVFGGDWTGSAAWVVAAFLLSGVVMNGASRSPDERRVMTPVALALCVLCAGVALGA